MMKPATRHQGRGRAGGKKYGRTEAPGSATGRENVVSTPLLDPRAEGDTGRHYWLVPMDGDAHP